MIVNDDVRRIWDDLGLIMADCDTVIRNVGVMYQDPDLTDEQKAALNGFGQTMQRAIGTLDVASIRIRRLPIVEDLTDHE